jgi:F-type H+-transporting ATPase subunit delta
LSRSVEVASRESYANAAEVLATLSADAEPAKLTGIGDEVLAIAGVLRREPRLRRALVDNSRSGSDRAALLRSVLGGKVSAEALDLVGTLAANRWSTAGELLDATERLGVDTLLAGAERADELSDVEDELFRFGQVVGGDQALASALADSTADADRRAELVRDLIEGKVRPATLRLVQLALAGFGGRGFIPSLSRLVELAAARRDRGVAYVTTASPLTDADEDRLAGRLSQMYGRQVSLKIDVDPRIIGGVRVQVGSDLYDGTVARRLAEARTALSK